MLQGKVAGVAFSKLSQADNVGYIIPWKIVAHFLREYNQHGTFRGCCSVGFRWQDMENAHMRDHYKVHSCPLAALLQSPMRPQPFWHTPAPPSECCVSPCRAVQADAWLIREASESRACMPVLLVFLLLSSPLQEK